MSIAARLAIAIAAAIPVAANAGTLTTLYSFTGGSDGASPYGPIAIQKGVLYGVSPGYKDNNESDPGNVFKFDIATGVFSVLYTFKGGTDSNEPNYMIFNDGMIYGTSLAGGSYGFGTVFSVNAKTGAETILYSFPPAGNGYPQSSGGLVYSSGVLYGVEQFAGPSNDGSIFAINLSSGAETELYDFTAGRVGREPIPALLFNKGLLYGATEYDGDAGGGTIYSFNLTVPKARSTHSPEGRTDRYPIAT
jgi:uncharacterized repeat protein (TIGR03803 family)